MPHYTFVEMTPNPLVEQSYDITLPLVPTLADAPIDIPLLGLVALAINGAAIYGPNEGELPDPYGDPIFNGIMDGCLGHTADAYHYHGLDQRCLDPDNYVGEPWTTAAPDPTVESPILGFALDGFPIYGPYGCLDADCVEVVEFTSGWVQIGDPTTYAWDNHEWQASADSTKLDECNGRIGPDGHYRYHATSGFPYVLGCYMGVPVGDDGGGGDPGEPTTCVTEADCVGECAAGSNGCTCHSGPNGDICLATCNVDGDCQDGEECAPFGACVPEGGPGGPP